MNKREATTWLIEMLKQSGVRYRFINPHKRPMRDVDLDQVYLFYNITAPGGIESDITLGDDDMWVRTYYSGMVSQKLKESGRTREVTEVINHINANVFFEGLYTPRLYLSTDGHCDVTVVTEIPYLFAEAAPEETFEYLTCLLPEMMELFAPSIVGVIYGVIDVRTAIRSI